MKMTDMVKDYSEDKGENNHYNGVPSMYGKLVREQQEMQPDYCMPGKEGGEMRGAKRNEQSGP